MQFIKHISVLTILLLLISCGKENGWRDFTIETHSFFPVQATATGKVKIINDIAYFKVASFQIQAIPDAISRFPISGYSIGLAYEEKPNWIPVNFAPFIKNEIMLPLNGSIKLEPFKTSMQIPKGVDFKGSWVLIKFTLPLHGKDDTEGFTYSHEPNTPTK
ncbi:MAG: hypothetical protein V7721_02315 [Porticoccaceae bacterium]